jgi:uncharacterized membrane protein YfcA
MHVLILLVVGLVAGVLSGMFGIGGGVIIVPALIFILKMKQMEATATSLAALIPPVGLLGAYEYYRNGNIHVGSALLVAAGLFAGAYFGAKITLNLPADIIRRMYGVFLLAISVKMLFSGN